MKNSKLIAPIIITIILVMILTAHFFFFFLMPVPGFIKVLILLALLALIGVAVCNLVERIQEIRSGEEDDLGKY